MITIVIDLTLQMNQPVDADDTARIAAAAALPSTAEVTKVATVATLKPDAATTTTSTRRGTSNLSSWSSCWRRCCSNRAKSSTLVVETVGENHSLLPNHSLNDQHHSGYMLVKYSLAFFR